MGRKKRRRNSDFKNNKLKIKRETYIYKRSFMVIDIHKGNHFRFIKKRVSSFILPIKLFQILVYQ